MAAPNCHVGTRLRSVCGFLGNTWVAVLPAGALVGGAAQRAGGVRAAGGRGLPMGAMLWLRTVTLAPSTYPPQPALPSSPNPNPNRPDPNPSTPPPPPPHSPAQCTLAKLIGPAPTTPSVLALYCTAGPLLLALLTINRVATRPPMLWAAGMDTLLIAGSALVQGYSVYPISKYWRAAVGEALLSGVGVACAACVLVSVLVLPSLASDQVRGWWWVGCNLRLGSRAFGDGVRWLRAFAVVVAATSAAKQSAHATTTPNSTPAHHHHHEQQQHPRRRCA